MVSAMANTYIKEKVWSKRMAIPTNGNIRAEVAFHSVKVMVPIHRGMKNIMFSSKNPKQSMLPINRVNIVEYRF